MIMSDDGIIEDDVIEDDITENEVVEFDFLSTIKTLLNVTDSSIDSLLSIYIDLTKESILNYCNRHDLPSALNYTLCQLVVDTYAERKTISASGDISGNISSISEDGRTVSFSSNSNVQDIISDKLFKVKILDRYKKLYRL